MTDISITRPHGRSVADARKLAEALVGKLATEFDVKHHWEGDVLRFERTGVKGQVAITPSDVEIHAKLGFLLKPLKGRIESEVNKILDKKLA